ncbi:metal ABC transporter permease [Corynebacterium sp. 3HC-13]|nr:metal ABC transporter permease [Corynebacterium poyangense]MBZ8176801.1 metal ABC transporter permease [Corynebacterium poyangense]
MWDEMVRVFGQSLEQLRHSLHFFPGTAVLSGAPYMFRAATMLAVLGVVGGIVGVLVNLRSAEFHAEATVHGIFPGIVVGSLWGGVDAIIPGAAIAAIAVVVALSIISRHHNTESGTAIILTSFYALGMVISLRHKDMSGQLEALMFGRLLDINDERLFQAVLVCLLAVVIVVVSWRQQIFFAFDRWGAQSAGLHAAVIDSLRNTAIAAVVVAASSAIGVLLVIGYIIIPGAAARLMCSTVATMVLGSVTLGVLGGWLGLGLMSLHLSHPISPQASVALSLCLLYAVVYFFHRLKQEVIT